MSGAVSQAAKPKLRGLLQGQIKINILTAAAVAGVCALAQKFLYNDKRKQVYAEFYSKYDIEKTFNEMREKGVFDSC